MQPIVDGTYGTRDFSKLMVLKRPLFQTEKWLVQGVVEGTEEDVAPKRMLVSSIYLREN